MYTVFILKNGECYSTHIFETKRKAKAFIKCNKKVDKTMKKITNKNYVFKYKLMRGVL